MVTNIHRYTLTEGEIKDPLLYEGETVKSVSLTGPTTFITTVTHALKPGRPWQAYYPGNFQCCMNCYVYFPNVDVYYWPVPESEAKCANDSKPLVTSQAILPTGAAKTAEARYEALYSNSSITGVVSTVNAQGFTFISPSVYVAFGDVSAGDACGAVGQKYTSVTLGFAPGVLHTVTALGKDHYETKLGTRAFDPANVLCPLDYEPETLFVDQDHLAGISSYRPRIQIPEALQNLDPAWKSCVVDDYEGIDPPHQLVPASGFEDDPVAITSVDPVQQPTPAAVAPPLPKNTGSGDGGDPVTLPADPQADPPATQRVADPVDTPDQGGPDPPMQQDPQQPNAQDPGKPAANDQADPSVTQPAADPIYPPTQVESDPPKQQNPQQPNVQDPGEPPSDTQADPGPGAQPAADPVNPPNQGGSDLPTQQNPQLPNAQDPGRPNQNGGTPAQDVQTGEGKPGSANQQEPQRPNAPDLGNANGGGENAVQDDPNGNSQPTKVTDPNSPPPDVQQQQPNLQPAQPAVVVQGQTVEQGAAPVTIGGKPVVYSKGSVYVDGAAAPAPTAAVVPVPSPQSKPQINPVNLEGFEFAPVAQPGKPDTAAEPAKAEPAVIVEGQTVKQGAPPVTINGNQVKYEGGSVQVNNEIVPITPPKDGEAPKPVVAQGMTITPGAIPPNADNQGKPNNSPGEPSNNLAQSNNNPGQSNNNPGQSNNNPVQQPRPAIIVKGQTISENGPPATINGKPIVYSGGAVFAGGTKVVVPTVMPGQPPASPINVAGLSFVPQPIPSPDKSPNNGPGPAVVVAGQTLAEGAPAINVNGATLAYSSGSVYVNGKAAPMPTPPPTSPSSAASAPEQAPAGEPIVVGGLTISAAPPSSQQRQANAPNTPIATIAGQVVAQRPNGAVIVEGPTPLTLGDSPIMISGTPISLNPSALIIDGSRIIPRPTIPSPQIIATVAENPVSQNMFGDLVVAGKTLSVGGAGITISGTPVSIATSAGSTFLVEGTRTVPITNARVTAAPALMIAGEMVAPNERGEYIVDGKTLSYNGQPVVIDGTSHPFPASRDKFDGSNGQGKERDFFVDGENDGDGIVENCE
ncbi:MAG: hypothetical protein Q9178_003430 [Gyalolechia marmorata]